MESSPFALLFPQSSLKTNPVVLGLRVQDFLFVIYLSTQIHWINMEFHAFIFNYLRWSLKCIKL